MQDATIAAIRYGFGLRASPQPASPTAVLKSLMDADRVVQAYPTTDLDQARQMLLRAKEARIAARDGDPDAQKASDAARDAIRALPREVLRATLARICDADAPMRERLTRFWVDHFTVALTSDAAAALIGSFIDDAIRPNLTGRFADLLRAAVTHPAMLVYLDQVGSIGPGSRVGRKRKAGLNENLAREVLELHTLGVGAAYTQDDVRQFAELLTGLWFGPDRHIPFRPGWAEPGGETVLGRTYGSDDPARVADIHAALDDLSVHPDTARHVSRKLAVHFVADTPSDALVDRMTSAWMATGGDLMAVYESMLDHPEGWGPVGGKAKQPLDFIASSLVALGLSGQDVMALDRKLLRQSVMRPMRLMGQRFLRPAGPDGWPEEAEAWITPLGLAQRIRWGEQMPRRLVAGPLPDPREFLDAVLADAAGERLSWAVGASETVPQGVALVLYSPQFNRR
ncbi:DUF1800 domain-containing protein [Oceaniglobus indicus]|uniref:DUF1800 domain-containing protein n=1 Tax=Oceaniglobus indicus TaxID=2047749 RepID=UPI0013043B28|nr:DUF1800 domain-containing protein [Oceaniglobus indicus]